MFWNNFVSIFAFFRRLENSENSANQLIDGNGYEAQKASKEKTKMARFMWKVHDRAQSFVLIHFI